MDVIIPEARGRFVPGGFQPVASPLGGGAWDPVR